MSEFGSEANSQVSRTLEQQFGGTDWAAVMRSLAQPSSDGGPDTVGVPFLYEKVKLFSSYLFYFSNNRELLHTRSV
jgi:hypothetical protein